MSKKEKQPREYRGVRDEIREQQLKTKDMSFMGKLKYFWYYYKIHTIIAVAAIFLLGTLIHDITTAKDYNFYAIMLNSQQLSQENMENAFAGYADLDTENYECLIDTSSFISMRAYSEHDIATAQKLIALVQTNDLDTLVMDSSVFYNYSLSELFADLRTVFTQEELSRYEDQLYYIDYAEVEAADEDTGFDEDSSYDPDAFTTENILAEAETHRHPENMEKPVPIGIYMTDSPFAQKTNAYSQTVPVFGVVAATQRVDTVKKYLKFLWDESIDFSQMIEQYGY